MSVIGWSGFLVYFTQDNRASLPTTQALGSLVSIIVDDLEVKRGGLTSIELSGNQYSPDQRAEAASESLSRFLTILYTTA